MTLKSHRDTPKQTLSHVGAWGLVKQVVAGVSKDELTGYSAQLAYYFFLSLFPSLLFITAVLAFLPIHHRTGEMLGVLGQALPKQALTLVKGNLADILHQHKDGLLSFGIAYAVYSASNAVIAIGTGLNQAYEVPEERPYWRLLLMGISLVLGLALVILIAFGIFFGGPLLAGMVAKHLPRMHILVTAVSIIRWPILLFAMVLITAMLYYFTPNVRQSWRWLTPGSLFAVLGWIATSLLFAFYVNHFGSYNKTYGSIGAIIVLLTWMYLSGLVLLIGGEINAVLKHVGEGVDKKTETPTDQRPTNPRQASSTERRHLPSRRRHEQSHMPTA